MAARWILTVAFGALIITLSLTPDRYEEGDGVFHWLVANTRSPIQKMLHVGVYAFFTLMLAWTFERLATRRNRVLLSAVTAVLFGLLLELLQLFVPGRFGSLYDVILNSVGALAGVTVALLLSKRQPTAR
jgi:glycopeptide antibiotics resistance protein